MIWKSPFFNGLTEKEESVLNEFYFGYYRKVYIYIHLLTPDQNCAKEVTPPTLLRVYRNANFDNETVLLESIQRIATEAWLDYIKKKPGLGKYYEEYLLNKHHKGRLDAVFNNAQELEKKVKEWKQLSPDEQVKKKHEYTLEEEGFATHYESPFMPNRQAMFTQSQDKHFATKGDNARRVQYYANIDPACDWKSFKKQATAQLRKKSSVSTMVMAGAAAILIAISFILVYYPLTQRQLPATNNIPQYATGKEPELILSDGSKIKLDRVPDGNIIAGVPFKKEGSKLVYMNTDPNDLILNSSFITLSVPLRRQYQVILSDGSVIDLNASSQLHFPVTFSENDRTVVMKGEAYFKVKANPEKPFFVKLKDQVMVKVTGTTFNIDAYNERDYVGATLLEGRVEITSNSSKRSVILHPGQQAIIRKGQFTIYDKMNINQVIAWKESYFDFEDRSIKEIMQEIGLWYNVAIKYNGEIPPTIYTGHLSRATSLPEIIKIMSVISGMRIVKTNDTLIISP